MAQESPAKFPIQRCWGRQEDGHMGYSQTGPKEIPWAMIAPHAEQARRNHMQTLEQLAQRGGLCACEAIAVLEDREWQRFESHKDAERLLAEKLREYGNV